MHRSYSAGALASSLSGLKPWSIPHSTARVRLSTPSFRRLKAPECVQGHVFNGGQRQFRVTVEAQGPVPDETVAMTVVAGQVQPGRRVPEP